MKKEEKSLKVGQEIAEVKLSERQYELKVIESGRFYVPGFYKQNLIDEIQDLEEQVDWFTRKDSAPGIDAHFLDQQARG